MFVVKWDDCWLAPFGWASSHESRTHDRMYAEEFSSRKLAKERINKIKSVRACDNTAILPC